MLVARSDLLISLVKAGIAGDKSLLHSTVEAIAAEERAHSHNALADRLQRALQGAGGTPISSPTTSLYPSKSSGREALVEVAPRKVLNDLVLSTVVRGEIERLIEEQLRVDLLRASGLEPRHRILLAGPPGNGKTTLAEAIAEAISVPLFVVRYEALIGSFLGETSTRLRHLFDYVRTVPCVLLFDEFDTIGKERGDTHETGEIKRVVSSLLMQIDSLPSYVVVVAATNHRELLDRAVWRRFEIRLELPAPTQKQLAAYFDNVFSLWPDKVSISGQMLARQLGAISYAEAADFCLDVQRWYVLSHKVRSVGDIVRERASAWRARIGPESDNGRCDEAFAAAERAKKREKATGTKR